MNARSWTTIPAAFALAAMALTGCGNSSSGADGEGSHAQSSSASPTAEAAAALSAGDFGQRLQDAQKKAGSYRFTMESGVAGKTLTGSGEADVSGDTPSVRVTMGEGAQAFETITSGGLIYMKSPMFKTDKPWLKIDPKAKSGFGALVGQMGGNQDPTNLAKAFGKVSTVKKGATEDVDGTEATKYTVTVAGADLAAAMNMPAQAASMLPKQIAYDIWVDGEDRPLKMTTEFAVGGQQSTTTMHFTDYGSSVTVEAPPADQVTTKEPDLGAMMGG